MDIVPTCGRQSTRFRQQASAAIVRALVARLAQRRRAQRRRSALAGAERRRSPDGGAIAAMRSADDSPVEVRLKEETASRGARLPGRRHQEHHPRGRRRPGRDAAGRAPRRLSGADPRHAPGAVALVDQDDWQAALAASVLMAPPLRAPMLLTDGEDLPARPRRRSTRSSRPAPDPPGRAGVVVGKRARARGPARPAASAGGDPYSSRPPSTASSRDVAGAPSRTS